MGRHAPAQARSHRQRGPRRRQAPALIGIAVATVLALVAAVWVVTRPDDQAAASPAVDAASCRIEDTVRVTVSPELGPVVSQLLSGQVPVEGGGCTVVELRTQEPPETLAALASPDSAAAPQIWLPEDAVWATSAGDSISSVEGTLAGSSLVLATSRAVAEGLGWDDSPPTWAQALDSPAGLAMPDPTADARGLLAVAALQNSTGGGDAGDKAVAAVTLAAINSPGPTVDAALTQAVAGAADAPVAVVTDQQVTAATRDGVGSLVRIVPTEGAPSLAVPILRTVSPTDDEAAVQAVLRRLAEAAADGAEVRAAGYRDAAGRGLGDVPPAKEMVLDPAVLAALPRALAGVATPGRLLVVVDTSDSMAATVGDGTRATLARDALIGAGAYLGDSTTAGVWAFANKLDGDDDWRQLLPSNSLGAVVDGKTQRELLRDTYATLPAILSGGGTGLYDTTLAAVRAARQVYDPAAINVVVLLTDGQNDDDPGGLTEQQLLDTLAAEADPARPVVVLAVGLGPTADAAALTGIADATGGLFYSALTPADLSEAFYQARKVLLANASG